MQVATTKSSLQAADIPISETVNGPDKNEIIFEQYMY